MIICTPIDDGKTAFERKYMFLEAKGTENRKNMRRITVDMTNGKPDVKINGKAHNVQDIDSQPEDDDDDVDLSELEDEANASDTSVGDIDQQPDDDDGDDDMGDMDIDEQPDDDAGDATGDDGGDDGGGGDTPDQQPDDDGTGDGDDTGDDTGDTGDGGGDDSQIAQQPDDGDSGGGDTSGDDNNDNDDGGDDNGNGGDKEEIMHKQALFGKYQTLYESIGNYTAKLDDVVGQTNETNLKIKEVNDQLKKLQDFIYDYMIIKFKDASYIESMLFYQRAIAVINLSLDMLDDVKKEEIKRTKTK